MSANFYNTNGGMAGVDLHMYVADIEMVPVLMPLHPHVCGVTFGWGISGEKTIVRTVTSEGFPMLQKKHEIYMFIHFPIPVPPPHALEAAEIAFVIAAAKTTPVMSVHSVTGKGEPLATCLKGAWGVNSNCGSPIAAPTGIVHNANTVRTTPTAGDFANAALGALWGAVGSILPGPLGKAWEKAGEFVEWVDNIEDELADWLDKKFWWKHTRDEIDKKRGEIVREILGG